MKKKISGGIAVLVIATIAIFNLNLNINDNDKLSLLSLVNVEALADESSEEKCDTGGSGKCYFIKVEEGLFGACRVDCKYDGRTTSSCSTL